MQLYRDLYLSGDIVLYSKAELDLVIVLKLILILIIYGIRLDLVCTCLYRNKGITLE